jgi:hypothetical protein
MALLFLRDSVHKSCEKVYYVSNFIAGVDVKCCLFGVAIVVVYFLDIMHVMRLK